MTNLINEFFSKFTASLRFTTAVFPKFLLQGGVLHLNRMRFALESSGILVVITDRPLKHKAQHGLVAKERR